MPRRSRTTVAPDTHTVDVVTPFGAAVAQARAADGGDRVGAWPERGILDTQLGPNRNGRKW